MPTRGVLLALDFRVNILMLIARAVRTADGLCTVCTLHAHFLGIALGFARYLEPTKQPPCDKKLISLWQFIVLTWEPSAGEMLLVTALEVFGVFRAGSR